MAVAEREQALAKDTFIDLPLSRQQALQRHLIASKLSNAFCLLLSGNRIFIVLPTEG